jgi:hypothetical protein
MSGHNNSSSNAFASFKIARVELFSEPVVDRSQQFARLLHLALITPQPRHTFLAVSTKSPSWPCQWPAIFRQCREHRPEGQSALSKRAFVGCCGWPPPPQAHCGRRHSIECSFARAFLRLWKAPKVPHLRRLPHSISSGGEVEASNTPTIRRLIPSCRHQLSPIARYSRSLIVCGCQARMRLFRKYRTDRMALGLFARLR